METWSKPVVFWWFNFDPYLDPYPYQPPSHAFLETCSLQQLAALEVIGCQHVATAWPLLALALACPKALEAKGYNVLAFF